MTRRPTPEEAAAEHIADKAARRIRAREARRHGAWFGLGMFGLIGWSIALPVIIGIVVGQRLDAWLGGRVSWTLTMMALGLALGCINAWYWMTREGRGD